MSKEAAKGIQIVSRADGSFEDISLTSGVLRDVVERGGEAWSSPILFFGPDVEAELATLGNEAGDLPWRTISSFRSLGRGDFRYRFEEIEPRLDRRFFEKADLSSRQRLDQMLTGIRTLTELPDFLLHGANGTLKYRTPYLADDFESELERLSNTHALVIPWGMRGSLLPALCLAIWKKRSRLYPLVLHAPRKFSVPGGGIEVVTAGLDFAALVEAAETTFGLNPVDIEKAYRVWQLSRSDNNHKSQATTPKSINVDTAKAFLGVLTRARTEDELAAAIRQHPAPLMLEFDHGEIKLRHSASSLDSQDIVAAGVSSLLRRFEAVEGDASIHNIVPGSARMMPVIRSLLLKLKVGDFLDLDVIELGLELNAFQWGVDTVKKDLSEISLGALTSLFATAHMVLARFPKWVEYSGRSTPKGGPDSGLAAFTTARELLETVRTPNAFLKKEATERIDTLLDRVPLKTDAPPLREGLVRSSENFAAVTVDGLSHVLTKEAKAFGGKIKDEAYKQASAGLVSYARENAPLLLKLGQLRDWPWMQWVHDILDGLH